VLCLAQNLYFEASTQPIDGLMAVAATVFNRQHSTQYPTSVCGVVYQPWQYTWTQQRSRWQSIPPRKYMELARRWLAVPEWVRAQFPPITHYHRTDVTPAWAAQLSPVMHIGPHMFYVQPPTGKHP
jgi:spore germination cell wall hydrolase CwlJ-like protein